MDPYLNVIQKQNAEFPNLFNRWVRIRKLTFHPADLNKRFQKLKDVELQEDISLDVDGVLARRKRICGSHVSSLGVRMPEPRMAPLFDSVVLA